MFVQPESQYPKNIDQFGGFIAESVVNILTKATNLRTKEIVFLII